MTGLLIVDMQVGLFEEGTRHDADGVVRRINQLARAVRAKGGVVLFIQHEDDDDFAHGEAGWKLLPALDSRPEDVYITKTACDSFYASDLGRVLGEHRIRKLLVTGCATDFCVDTTTRSAASKDYEVVVVADGHTTKDRPHLGAEAIIAHHNWMWSNLILPGNPVRVVPADELLASL